MNIKKLSSMLMINMLLVTCTATLPLQKVYAATQSTITRSQSEQRALNMINLTWTYSSAKNSNISSKYASQVTQPSQLDKLTTTQVTGIPYNWGGLDGLDSNSYNAPWSNFLDAVNNGAYIGNVNTEAGYGYIPGTAGIDCSGFIQATFNIQASKLSTSSLFNSYFNKISLNDIKHMDILNKPSDHVVIFDKWGSSNGVYGAFTYESTPDQTYGGIQGTKKYFLSMDEINNGYIPGKYVNIVEDSTNQSTTPHPVNPGVFGKISNVITNANFRANPSLNSNIIGTIPKDTILYLIDYSSGWYQVSYNGHLGWVWGNLISSIPSGKYVTVKNVFQLNIRTSGSSSSSILGVLSEKQYAEVLDYSSDEQWAKIRINGIEGYAYMKYLSYIY